MKVKITRSTEHIGIGAPPIESFYLEVEKEVGDTEGAVVEVYLALRKRLNEGIKEDK